MSESTLEGLSAPTLSFDQACPGCGYNLRGQRLEWKATPEPAHWGCRCPECGASQWIEDPNSYRTTANADRWLLVTTVLIAGWLAWLLMECLSLLLARLSALGPDGTNVRNVMTRGGLSVTPPDLTTEVIQHLLAYGVPTLLCGTGLGAIVSLGRFAKSGHRDYLASLLLAIASLWSVGRVFARDGLLDQEAILIRLQSPRPIVLPDFATGFAYFGTGLILALLGIRIGVAVGKRTFDWIVQMFVPLHLRRGWLRQ
ncbi:MAG: hypothetical protein QM770_15535 [Tepidisphaeraceae bacterium]